jgi:DNA-binding response OmpR family regulator
MDLPQREQAKGRILIVDDEIANVQLLEMLLGNAGFSCLKSTTDSREVVALYQEFDPDVILLDLSMPHLDGFEVMARLRALIPPQNYVPILVLTAMVTPEAKRRALSAGANDFLTKPFDVAEVLLRTRNLLDTRRLHVELQQYNGRLESAVKERTQELAGALSELQVAQQQIIQQERFHAFGVMAGGVAHDFNNVLSIVLGFGELVLADCDGVPGREKDAQAMRLIVTAAQDGARMVTRLREFHRPDGSSLEASLPWI